MHFAYILSVLVTKGSDTGMLRLLAYLGWCVSFAGRIWEARDDVSAFKVSQQNITSKDAPLYRTDRPRTSLEATRIYVICGMCTTQSLKENH